ncbi:MAG: proline dehydrogenase family protein [Euryarchaeota archaeon]|nr:proline dehydrogenase family protein [Euryarchaeota archaeon]MBU4339298.1 proline dehydrogenase family protein [Euryarchaeota archaeon]
MSFLIRFVRHWIAGETPGDAIASAKKKNRAGLGAIINFLGEHVRDKIEAQENVEKNIKLLSDIEKEKVNASISLKLTSLGLLIDKRLCLSNVEKIASVASSKNIFVWIDMENSPYTEDTIDIYLDIFTKFGNAGIAIQANLKRSENDVRRITAEGGMIRLVKGAYSEKKDIAFFRRSEVTKNFSKLMGFLFYKSASFAIATHDEQLINEAIEVNKVHKKRLEFQMLMGVREELKRQLVSKGFNVVDYIPYGNRWLPYTIRRLSERKSNILLIMRSVFDI